jgi:DNA repair exonuclease SbcCD ATPase subunit
LEERKLDLDREVEELDRAVDDLREEMRPFQDKTAELNEEKSDRSSAKDILLQDLRTTQESYAKKKLAINGMTTKVSRLVSKVSSVVIGSFITTLIQNCSLLALAIYTVRVFYNFRSWGKQFLSICLVCTSHC